MSETTPESLAGSWSRRRFLAAAAAAPVALWLPLPPGSVAGILRAHGGAGTTYYVSPRGNDAQSGTSPLEAWRTVARVNQARLGPGDAVLFEGGQTFTGMLHITDSGTEAAPIRFGSCGTERATLAREGDDHGLYIENAGHITVENLNLDGRDRMAGSQDGLRLAVRNTLRRGYTFRNLDIYRWGHNGLRVSAHAWREGVAGRIEDVLIENVHVYNCRGEVGLSVWGERGDYESIRNVTIRGCRVNDIIGTGWRWSGSGIILFWVTNFLVEHCAVSDCGLGSGNEASGPVGIWTSGVRNGVFQFCEVYDCHADGTNDGGAFDLDGGTQNVTIQYCYTHDNDGSGFTGVQWDGPFGRNRYNVVRFCISENDGRVSGSPFSFWRDSASGNHGINNWDVYGNSFVVTDPAGSPLFGLAQRVSEVRYYNNIHVTAGSRRLARIGTGTPGVIFRGNNWYAPDGIWEVEWDGTLYSSLAAWREGSGQERLAGQQVGTDVDPQLLHPGGGGTLGDPHRLESLNAYRLAATSPMPTAGLDLRALGIDPGERDFYGTPIPPEGPYRAVGAAATAGKMEDGPAAVRSEEPRGRLARLLGQLARGRPRDRV